MKKQVLAICGAIVILGSPDSAPAAASDEFTIKREAVFEFAQKP